MIDLQGRTIYVYTIVVDMRKSITGLSLLLSEQFSQAPQNGDLYLFTNRTRDKIKCLCWDKNGFVLYYKRFERGRFNFSKYIKEDKIIVSEQQLKALLIGLDFYLLNHCQGEHYKNLF